MNKDEALTPVRKLRERLEDIAKSLNLEIETFAYLPGSGDYPDTFQVAAVIRAEAVMSEEELEQVETDKKFQSIERNLQLEHLFEERLPDIEKDIQDWFELPGESDD